MASMINLDFLIHIIADMNPLELPEILFRIGQFIPIWKLDPYKKVNIFCPETLLACLLVSRTWNSTLHPLLWLVFDGRCMFGISVEIFRRNLVHTRYVDTLPTCLLTTHLPSLTDLTIRKSEAHSIGSEIGNIELVKNNPQLQMLDWTGFLPLSPSIPWSFLDLTRLTDLTLDRWHNKDGGFVEVLVALSKTLTHLSLFRISGVDRSSFKSLCLPNLISLEIGFFCVGSVGFEDLVCCCPNLEKLVIWPEEDSDIYRLVKNIKAYCPRMTSFASQVRTLPEMHILELIRSCRTLVSFECRVTSISKPLTEALLQHHSTLKSLTLSPQAGNELMIEGFVDILQSFTDLEELSLTGHILMTDAILVDGLFRQPWACLNLKVLRIDGYRPTLPHEKIKSLSSISGTCAVFRWHLHRSGNFATRQSSKLLWVLFHHVQNLAKLQKVYLNGIEYCRVLHPF